jgi:hypothetical protein
MIFGSDELIDFGYSTSGGSSTPPQPQLTELENKKKNTWKTFGNFTAACRKASEKFKKAAPKKEPQNSL